MAITEVQMRRLMENALGLTANALNNPLGAGQNIRERIESAGDVSGGIISLLQFHRKEDKDVNDWIRQFEVAFATIGKAAEANGTRQAAYAATCLKGAAAQWYNEMKETAVGNLINWADADNDNDLKHRIKRRFTREDVRRRKMLELKKIIQGKNESVEEYTRRFRQILRIATRGNVLADELQVDFYMEGLEPMLGYQVRRENPGNLQDAINRARREEDARTELYRKTMNIPSNTDQVYPDIGKGNDNRQNIEKRNILNKPLTENYEDELTKDFEKMRINRMERRLQNMERRSNMNRGNNNQGKYNTQINYDEITCWKCNRKGHFANRCPTRNDQRNNRRINLMDNEYYEENYNDEEYDEFDDNYEEYNEYDEPQIYQFDRELYEKDNHQIKERRRSNRLNPEEGRKRFRKPSLREEIAGVQNGMNIDNNTERNQIYDQPIGPNPIPKGMKWSNRRNQMYDPMEGLRRWRAAGGKAGPRESKITGVKPEDKVDYESLLNIVSQQGNMIKKMMKKGDNTN